MALDKGDNRIREFMKLWIKAVNQEKLTQIETYKLRQYNDAAKDCLLLQSTITLPKSSYQELLNLGWHPGKKDFIFSTTESKYKFQVNFKVLDVKKTNSKIIIEGESVTPVYSVFKTLLQVEEKILYGVYSKTSKEMQLSERYTYTFQNLSEKAARLFYPEGMEIIEEDIKKCESDENTSNQKSEL